jgi:hypothetical protein
MGFALTAASTTAIPSISRSACSTRISISRRPATATAGSSRTIARSCRAGDWAAMRRTPGEDGPRISLNDIGLTLRVHSQIIKQIHLGAGIDPGAIG